MGGCARSDARRLAFTVLATLAALACFAAILPSVGRAQSPAPDPSAEQPAPPPSPDAPTDSAPAGDRSGKGGKKGDGKGGKKGGNGKNAKHRRAEVQVATTGNSSERFKTLPITKSPWEEPRTVMSLPPSKMPRLLKGDRFRVSSELQLTTNCLRRKQRCKGPPYRFDPMVKAELRIYRSARPNRGATSRLLTKGSERCGRANQEHHCVLTLRSAQMKSMRKKLRCKPTQCRVNLVVTAFNANADPADRIIVGGLRPDGTVPQDRGRINVVHIRPHGKPLRSDAFRSNQPRISSVPIDNRRHTVFSKAIPVRRGDELEVSARVQVSVEDLPYMTAVSSQLILAGSAGRANPGGRGGKAGFLNGEIDESNGFNCTRKEGICTVEKVGVMKIKGKVKKQLFVNLTMAVGPKYAQARPGDGQRVLRGRLQVIRYR